ncbi:unnamed protein product, partial [Phaeothamnion confervicola]
MLAHLGPLAGLVAADLSVEGLEDVSLLACCPRLAVLTLNVNRLPSPVGLSANAALVRLFLRDNSMTTLDGLRGLSSLRSLHVDTNRLSSLDALSALPSLTHLSARTNRLDRLPADPPMGFRLGAAPAESSPMPAFWAPGGGGAALRRLELYHNRLGALPRDALAGLPWLTHLDLGRNRLRAVDGAALNRCPALEKLVLSENELVGPPAPLALPLLRELWMSGNRLASLEAWQPSEAACLYLQDNELTSLRGGHENGKDDGSRGCERSPFVGTPLLATLDLSFNRLKDPAELAYLAVAARLADLRLHDNPWAGAG